MRHYKGQRGTIFLIALGLFGLAAGSGCNSSGGSGSQTIATTPNSLGNEGPNYVNGAPIPGEAVPYGNVLGESFTATTAFVMKRHGQHVLVLTNEQVSPCHQFEMQEGGISINVFLPEDMRGRCSNTIGNASAPRAAIWNASTGAESDWTTLSTYDVNITGQQGNEISGTLELGDNQGGVIQGTFTALICD